MKDLPVPALQVHPQAVHLLLPGAQLCVQRRQLLLHSGGRLLAGNYLGLAVLQLGVLGHLGLLDLVQLVFLGPEGSLPLLQVLLAPLYVGLLGLYLFLELLNYLPDRNLFVGHRITSRYQARVGPSTVRPLSPTSRVCLSMLCSQARIFSTLM